MRSLRKQIKAFNDKEIKTLASNIEYAESFKTVQSQKEQIVSLRQTCEDGEATYKDLKQEFEDLQMQLKEANHSNSAHEGTVECKNRTI